MFRAFAMALGVGTVRIWIGLFQFVGLLSIWANAGTAWFGVAFWLAFLMHAPAAELYLRARPSRIQTGSVGDRPTQHVGELADLPLPP